MDAEKLRKRIEAALLEVTGGVEEVRRAGEDLPGDWHIATEVEIPLEGGGALKVGATRTWRGGEKRLAPKRAPAAERWKGVRCETCVYQLKDTGVCQFGYSGPDECQKAEGETRGVEGKPVSCAGCKHDEERGEI